MFCMTVSFSTSLSMIPWTENRVHDCHMYATNSHRHKLKTCIQIHNSAAYTAIVCAKRAKQSALLLQLTVQSVMWSC